MLDPQKEKTFDLIKQKKVEEKIPDEIKPLVGGEGYAEIVELYKRGEFFGKED